MKGELCPYDHGNDALILDETSLTTSVSQSSDSQTGKLLPSSNVAPTRPLLPQGLPLNIPFPPPPVSTFNFAKFEIL